MKRRNFLKTAVAGAVAGSVRLQHATLFAKGREQDKPCDLVAVMGGTPVEMYERAIASLGGMAKYVKRGQKVVVKPNIGWDKTPEEAANTNPELVAAIVRDCLKAGASEVTVFDNTCDEWQACYKNSGIEAAVRAAGAKMAFAHEERYYKEVSLPKAVRMKKTKIHEAILDCDVWFNVPILKNHGGAKMTIAMKNYMGIVWDRRFMHANDLQQCIADAASYHKCPALHIVDAYRIMTQNGPKGKSIEDVQMGNALFISPDMVAVDTAAVHFFNQFKSMTINDASHIIRGEAMQLGTTKLENLNIERIRI
ncbi:MAG: DUF362 domain-containing protein [Bacteroidales bacterium]|nr:DUF362 domain-containing protein [Bacteroidales bacterium]MCL2738302.1 DUF362 domain-containing protein [Bacteroidales bacterium]